MTILHVESTTNQRSKMRIASSWTVATVIERKIDRPWVSWIYSGIADVVRFDGCMNSSMNSSMYDQCEFNFERIVT